jgi:uncharacterized membrane protein YfcA
MLGHEIALLAAALLSEILGTIGGFGSSTFFVPLAQFFESVTVVLAVTSLLHIFGNTAKLVLFGKFIDRSLLLRFSIPAVVMTGVGAWLTDKVPNFELSLFLGILLILLSLVFLIKPHLKIPTSSTSIILSSTLS